MNRQLAWLMPPAVALVAAAYPGVARGQQRASWLDQTKPPSWNARGASIPAAPKVDGAIDSRCRAQARPPQLEEDRRVQARGWDLVGAYQGGWQTLVIQGTAGYDGMCRPRMYQAFVFVRGVFAGTLSPQPMDSRTDGALSRVTLVDKRITAEYLRYTPADPLCCASRTALAVFDVTSGPLVGPAGITHSALSRSGPTR
jgi:hypothetical protein